MCLSAAPTPSSFVQDAPSLSRIKVDQVSILMDLNTSCDRVGKLWQKLRAKKSLQTNLQTIPELLKDLYVRDSGYVLFLHSVSR